ncbi:uncharacterized protein J7T54_005037 [Emericellopsis cladophorae]|uniref:Uncharacterized protein n=1 Tax=Emericellopsis cladophorae TaxID=2686198 RepID=A0A9P9XVD2_9HYPO|nr:uncharacterized protein J7T54_005037 [Emericellopsis cladophorae]KAI6778513.1 hypothetical protein J7T54_005037 [Emericellopsis cladophorae]
MKLTFLLVSVSVLAGSHLVLSLVAGYLAWYYRKQWKRLQAQRSVDDENPYTLPAAKPFAGYRAMAPSAKKIAASTHDAEKTRRRLASPTEVLNKRSGSLLTWEEFILSAFEHPRTPPVPPMPVKSAERGVKRASWSLAAEIAKTGESSKQPQAMEN